MLNFSPWKVATIVVVLLAGFFLALPNALPSTFMGVPPGQPRSQSPEDLQAFESQTRQASEAWWPGFLPSNKVKLGLDLQGGVYLLLEIDPDEIVANQMEIVQRDMGEAVRGPATSRIGRTLTADGTALNVALLDPSQSGEAMRRMRAANPAVQGTIGGQRQLDITDNGNGRFTVTMTPAAREDLLTRALGNTISIVRRRVDPDGVSEISVQPQGENRIVLEAPGEADPQRIKNILGQAGRLTFNLVNASQGDLEAALTGRVRPGFSLLYDQQGFPFLINDTPVVTGSDIATAAQGFDPDDNSPAVDFRLSGAGARRFGDTTAANVNRQFAIVLDGRVMSAPRINEPIYGGSVQISGGFAMEEAIDLAAIIAAGELPAKIQFINERSVSATLGADSIRAGTTASIIGLVLVALFMILAYGRLGVFAVISLMANIMLILGALSGLGATLTLPGIAGIILTIGMAVDANVLVFERIREETRNGRGAISAVQAGYQQALSTILDANITTFIAAAMLYVLGSGPVKGFAVTLAIGIITSVFTAFMVTRWITAIWLKASKPKKLAL